MWTLAMFGVVVGAISGALVAGRKGMDAIGVLFLAVVTAIGGGSLRDILLGSYPIFWIQDPAYLLVAVSGGFLTVVITPVWGRISRFMPLADALVLALFTAMGAEKALELGHAWPIVVTMGVITGVAGGIIRDVLAAEVSRLFLKGELYSVAAIASVFAMLGLIRLGVDHRASLWIGVALCVAIRMAALRWGWTVPVLRLPKEGE